ncbi:hypothetical protein [Spirobacillus cienkowskii]|uniref:hypothetical protein n=1 Tax=Spirobacillus cienkowskii TaxID=495820 RepID=UPI0030CC11B2
MNKKPLILAAAVSGLSVAANGSDTPQTVTQEVEKCFGIQKKGENGCGIENDDIAAANAAFKNKYKKSTTFECAGNVLGSGKNGYLAWVYVARGSCHKIEGGFLIIQDKSGKKTVDKG